METDIGETDRRAVVVGAAVGAAVTVLTVAPGGQWTEMVVVAGVVASFPAGAAAAYASRERMQPFREGAYAGAAGLLVGVIVWLAGVSVVTSAYPLDVFLILTPFAYVAATLAFPMSFFVGGIAGHAALTYAL